jgi:hypothetical protein
MSYATLAEFKEWVSEGSLFDAESDDQIQMVLDAVDLAVNRYCGRTFGVEQDVSKFYYPQSTDEVQVTDLLTVTSLASDTSGDRTYSLLFAPADASGQPAVRYDLIRLWPTTSKSFSPGRLVKIVGDFGYVDANGNPPADVKTASLIMASRWWKRRETPLGILSATDLGTFERLSKEDPDVSTLLAPYSGSRSGWVAV